MGTSDLIEVLEQAEADGAGADQLDQILARVESEQELWGVADGLVAYPELMEAVCRRAKTLGADNSRAHAYVALSHIFAGEPGAAVKALGPDAEHATDEVVLAAWSLLPETRAERMARLRAAVARLPNSLRLMRQYANETLRSGPDPDARRAHQWLLEHEDSDQERARVAAVIRDHGW